MRAPNTDSIFFLYTVSAIYSLKIDSQILLLRFSFCIMLFLVLMLSDELIAQYSVYSSNRELRVDLFHQGDINELCYSFTFIFSNDNTISMSKPKPIADDKDILTSSNEVESKNFVVGQT